MVKQKLLKEIKNVFPFGQGASGALLCPRVAAACLKGSNAPTSRGQSALTKARAFSLLKHRGKGMETPVGTQGLGCSAPHTPCGALVLPPRTAVPAPAAGTHRSASGEGDSKDLGTGQLVGLSTGGERGSGPKGCAHRFAALPGG